MIWRASESGRITYSMLKKYKQNIQVIGFIDKYKEGHIYGQKIYKLEELNELKFDYCFICTEGGKKEAENFLLDFGYQYQSDYDYGYLI